MSSSPVWVLAAVGLGITGLLALQLLFRVTLSRLGTRDRNQPVTI